MIPHMVCTFVGHQRSVSCARRIDDVWQSRCNRCGADVVRVRPTKWREVERVERRALRRAH